VQGGIGQREERQDFNLSTREPDIDCSTDAQTSQHLTLLQLRQVHFTKREKCQHRDTASLSHDTTERTLKGPDTTPAAESLQPATAALKLLLGT